MTQEENTFTQMETLAQEYVTEAQRIQHAAPDEAVQLMNKANSLAKNAARGRELHREVATSYTPQDTPPMDIARDLYQGNQAAMDQAQVLAQETHATPESIVPVPTLPFKSAVPQTSGVKTWGPDEYLVRQTANTVVPTMASIATNVVKAAGQVISNVMPDELETSIVESVKRAHYDVTREDWYQKAASLLEDGLTKPYEAWKKAKPDQAELFEDVTATVGLIFDRTRLSEMAEQSGTKLSIKGAQGKKIKRFAFVSDMLAPLKPDSTQNPNSWTFDSKGNAVFVPNKAERLAIGETSNIPEIKPNKPAGANRTVIDNKIKELSERLEEGIRKAGNPTYAKHHLNATVGAHVDELIESTGFRAAAGSTTGVGPLLEHMQTLVANADGSAIGLLRLRREFDEWVRTDVKLADLDKQARTSLERVVTNVRGTLNTELSKLVPNVPVKRLLSRTSALYTARGMISPKADKELNGLLESINQGLYSTFNVKLPSTLGALYATGKIGAGIATSVAAPALGALAGGSYAIYKGAEALTNPTVRKGVGDVIVALSKAIKTVKDPVQLSMMRGDRAILLQALSDTAATPEEEEENTGVR